MKVNSKKLAKWIVGIVATCILIYLGVRYISVVANAVSWLLGILSPLILGILFALILNVPMRFFEKHLFSKTPKKFLQKLRRPLALVLAFIIIIGILTGVICLVIPELLNALKIICENAISLFSKITSMRKQHIFEQPPISTILANIDLEKIIASLENWVKTQGGSVMSSAITTISSFVSGIVNFFLSLILAIYILLSKETLKDQCRRLVNTWLPKQFAEWFIHAGSVANLNLRNFVSGQTLEAMILGILCMIGMFILQIPYAPMISALVCVCALIPVVGAFVAVGVGAFMIITVSPVKALIFVIFFIALQQIEGNFIYPKTMGSKIKLPALWILTAVTIGGNIAGAIGMLASVPIAATLFCLVKEATGEREKLLTPPSKEQKTNSKENSENTKNQ